VFDRRNESRNDEHCGDGKQQCVQGLALRLKVGKQTLKRGQAGDEYHHGAVGVGVGGWGVPDCFGLPKRMSFVVSGCKNSPDLRSAFCASLARFFSAPV
jgi:hypothetical protein